MYEKIAIEINKNLNDPIDNLNSVDILSLDRALKNRIKKKHVSKDLVRETLSKYQFSRLLKNQSKFVLEDIYMLLTNSYKKR